MARKPALGRGLKALIPDTPRARAGLTELPVDRIAPNPSQPRRRFDEAALEELAASLKEHGLLQPVVVSDDGEGGYVLIAGERRWRAARRAGLATIPAVIRERPGEAAALELALVENLQRRDLTPVEEAHAFEEMRTRFGLSQAEIAQRVGRDRSTVANTLRLLRLPVKIQELLEEGRLSAGHARALLAFDDPAEQLRWAHRAAQGGATVRDLERAAAGAEGTPGRTSRGGRRPDRPVDPNIRAAEERLSLKIGAPVKIRQRRRGGSIIIECGEDADLVRVFDVLLGEASHGQEQ
ncbi:MAG TPA: ParB/RepB/Spo0J family partition protein [Acidobacteria bacterium]|nr:ParB/RepB/Spo0J family partition protein [Acidobacteriota bacterium]